MATNPYQVAYIPFGSHAEATPEPFFKLSEAVKFAASQIRLGAQNVRLDEQVSGTWKLSSTGMTAVSNLLSKGTGTTSHLTRYLTHLSDLAATLAKTAKADGLKAEHFAELAVAHQRIMALQPAPSPVPVEQPKQAETIKQTVVASPTGR